MCIRKILIMILTFGSYYVHSNINAEEFLNNTSHKMISSLQQISSAKNNKDKEIYKVIKNIMSEYIDIDIISKGVLGKSKYQQLNDSQKSEFYIQLKEMVIQFYARALNDYTDESIKVIPSKIANEQKNTAKVKAIIIRKNDENIPMTYSLRKVASNWLIYDISLEGISLLSSFKDQIQEQLSTGSIDALIANMRTNNSGWA